MTRRTPSEELEAKDRHEQSIQTRAEAARLLQDFELVREAVLKASQAPEGPGLPKRPTTLEELEQYRLNVSEPAPLPDIRPYLSYTPQRGSSKNPALASDNPFLDVLVRDLEQKIAELRDTVAGIPNIHTEQPKK